MGLYGIVGRHYKILITTLVFLLAVGYVHKLCWPHKEDHWFEYGFHPYEKWKQGRMRWTWRTACMKGEATSDLFRVSVTAMGYNSSGPAGLELKVFLNDKILDTIHFFNGGSRELCYFVPGIRGTEVEIRMEVDRTFNPLRIKISQDGRDLGVAVSPVTFLKILPKDGVGFYGWERVHAGGRKTEVRGPRAERFRWTGKRASVGFSDQWPPRLNILEGSQIQLGRVVEKQGAVDGLESDKNMVFLKCAHPDIGKAPVIVRILGNGELLRHFEFGNHDWRKVEFEGKELEGVEVITYEVSRTWNPKRMGISGDWRDLGVAVAVP